MTEKSTFSKSIIIIGAGLAGLSTGCYAQMNGYQTRILEQHTRAGGACTSWKRKGYTIDGCLRWLVGCHPGSQIHRLYQEVGALDGNRFITLNHLARLVDEDGRQCLDITADLDRLAADMKALSPQDSGTIDELIEVARGCATLDIGLPFPLRRPWQELRQAWANRRWLTYAIRYNVSLSTFAARIQSPFLRWTLTHLLPAETPSILLFVLLGQLAAGNVAMVEGGSLAFALSIARRYRELGGQVIYDAPVKTILVEDGQAVGVRLADGSEQRADIVVSAADGYSTLFDMLDGQYVNAGIRKQYRTWPLSRPLLLVSYGTGQTFPGWPAENLIKLRQPLDIAGRQVETLGCRVCQDPALAPQGKTNFRVTIETEFDYWSNLSADRARYDAEKERVAAQVLERLQIHFPGIAAQVEMVDVATPHTFWRYTRNHHAASQGWLLTPQHTPGMLFYRFSRRPAKTLPRLSHFYMAGQWVEPGGTVPAVLASGRQVIQILCYHEGRPFVADTP